MSTPPVNPVTQVNPVLPDYGEPWEYTSFRNCIRNRHNHTLELQDELRDRARQCVNACAGMADPAAEIEHLTLALELANEEAATRIKKLEDQEAEIQAMREAISQLQSQLNEAHEAKLGLAQAQAKLSTVHQWIERNHPDGFIDSQTHRQNLDRVTDVWHERLDAAERQRHEALEANAAIQAREAELVLSKDRIAKRAEAMRQAIQCADRLLEADGYDEENMTRAKLQPFLNPVNPVNPVT